MKEEMSRSERFAEWLMLHFRWVFVLNFLLPASIAEKTYSRVRNSVIQTLQSAPRSHGRRVAKIQKQVREWNEGDKKQKMCTARPGWLTMSFRFPLYKRNMKQISTHELIDILEVNIKEGYVVVEPMVTMGQLSNHLQQIGYGLPIVPELDDLTVGGMINGCGVEASGIRYGMFADICLSYDIVLPDGSLVTACKPEKGKPSENSQLFHGIPWSHGTIGFLVAAKLQIIKITKHIQLTYVPTNSLQETAEVMEAASNCDGNEFVEGLLFSKDSGVVMVGRYKEEVDLKEGPINAIGAYYKKWFYTHVEDIAKKGETYTEHIPVRDFYHRHSKSIFWEMRDIVPFGNNPLFRYLLGWACPPKISLLKLTTPNILRRLYNRKHVLQDMLVPFENLQETVEVFEKEVKIYPLWVCPFKLMPTPGMLRNATGGPRLFVDVGAYGLTEQPDYDPVETTRRLEEYVRSVGGFQMLYADCYQTRAEFWTMFDSTYYEFLRCEHDCKQAFPDVYDKVCRAARF